jgi:hypothetical protein
MIRLKPTKAEPKTQRNPFVVDTGCFSDQSLAYACEKCHSSTLVSAAKCLKHIASSLQQTHRRFGLIGLHRLAAARAQPARRRLDG